jgi:hypothetical protein
MRTFPEKKRPKMRMSWKKFIGRLRLRDGSEEMGLGEGGGGKIARRGFAITRESEAEFEKTWMKQVTNY